MVVNPYRCTLYWASKSAQIWQVGTSGMESPIPRRLASLYPYTYYSAGNGKRYKRIKEPKLLMTIFEVE